MWIQNETVESGQLIGTAFPGAVYTVQARTEHTVTITGIDNVQALEGHVSQCVYEDLGTFVKSNAVKYSFVPRGQSMCCTECPSWCIHMSIHTNCWCKSSNVHLSRSHDPSLVDSVVEGVREGLCLYHSIHHTIV